MQLDLDSFARFLYQTYPGYFATEKDAKQIAVKIDRSESTGADNGFIDVSSGNAARITQILTEAKIRNAAQWQFRFSLWKNPPAPSSAQKVVLVAKSAAKSLEPLIGNPEVQHAVRRVQSGGNAVANSAHNDVLQAFNSGAQSATQILTRDNQDQILFEIFVQGQASGTAFGGIAALEEALTYWGLTGSEKKNVAQAFAQTFNRLLNRRHGGNYLTSPEWQELTAPILQARLSRKKQIPNLNTAAMAFAKQTLRGDITGGDGLSLDALQSLPEFEVFEAARSKTLAALAKTSKYLQADGNPALGVARLFYLAGTNPDNCATAESLTGCSSVLIEKLVSQTEIVYDHTQSGPSYNYTGPFAPPPDQNPDQWQFMIAVAQTLRALREQQDWAQYATIALTTFAATSLHILTGGSSTALMLANGGFTALGESVQNDLREQHLAVAQGLYSSAIFNTPENAQTIELETRLDTALDRAGFANVTMAGAFGATRIPQLGSRPLMVGASALNGGFQAGAWQTSRVYMLQTEGLATHADFNSIGDAFVLGASVGGGLTLVAVAPRAIMSPEISPSPSTNIPVSPRPSRAPAATPPARPLPTNTSTPWSPEDILIRLQSEAGWQEVKNAMLRKNAKALASLYELSNSASIDSAKKANALLNWHRFMTGDPSLGGRYSQSMAEPSQTLLSPKTPKTEAQRASEQFRVGDTIEYDIQHRTRSQPYIIKITAIGPDGMLYGSNPLDETGIFSFSVSPLAARKLR